MINASEYVVENVHINSDGNGWWMIIIFVLIAVALYILYKRFHKVKQNIEEEKKVEEKKIDYKKIAKEMLVSAKKNFEEKKFKESYGLAAAAVRFYYSYKFEIRTELTNTKLLNYLKENKKPFKEAQECFNLSQLVEFAKYEPNKKDFDRIVSLAENIIV